MQHRVVYTDGVTIEYCDLTSWHQDIPVPVLLPGSIRVSSSGAPAAVSSLPRRFSVGIISVRTLTPSAPNSSVTGESENCVLPTVLLRIFVFAVVVFLHDTRFLRNKRRYTRPQLVTAASVVCVSIRGTVLEQDEATAPSLRS